MINQDSDVDGLPAWSAARSSDLIPAYSVAVLKSNTWPGACTFGFDRKFENVYIGFGHKYSSENYSPPPPPPVFEEYLTDLEVTEIDRHSELKIDMLFWLSLIFFFEHKIKVCPLSH